MIPIEQMIATVESYIYKKKGRNIRIEFRYHPFFIHRDLEMLNYAYGIALDDI